MEPLGWYNKQWEKHLQMTYNCFLAFLRLMSSTSLPASKVQQLGLGSDEQADEKRIPHVLKNAEFSNVPRAVETQVNMILDTRF